MCHRCTATDDKLTCNKCWARMLHMCPDTISCIATHCVCPFCNQPITIAAIESSPLFGSNVYNRRVLNILRPRLVDVMRDREVWRSRAEDLARILRAPPEEPAVFAASHQVPELVESESGSERGEDLMH